MRKRFSFKDFYENWIYPAYKLLRIFGYDRYDTVKSEDLNRLEFYELDKRILHSNFQLFMDFVKHQKPFEKLERNDGPFFILKKNYKNLGIGCKYTIAKKNRKPIMYLDVMKEIYNYWTVERPQLKIDMNEIATFNIKDSFTIFINGNSEDEIKFESDYNRIVGIAAKYGIVISNSTDSVLRAYGVMHNIINEKDTEYLIWIIKLREYFW